MEQLEAVVRCGMHVALELTRHAQVNGTLVLSRSPQALAQLGHVGNVDDQHRRNRAHDGQILKGHVRAAVRRSRHAGIRADDLHVLLGVGDGEHHLVAVAPRHKRREAHDEWNKAIGRHTGRHGGHVCLRNADIIGAVRKQLTKAAQSSHVGEVRVKKAYALVLAHQASHLFAQSLSHFDTHSASSFRACSSSLSPMVMPWFS